MSCGRSYAFQSNTSTSINQDLEGKTPLHIAVLNNQVETVRGLLRKYSGDSEIQDKNNKYPYQYAIDNCNREILKLFSHYYKERKAEIERTEGKFAYKVGLCNSVKKVHTIISVCVNISVPLYVGITSLVAKSKIDIFKDSLSNFIFPTFYKIYQYVLNVQEGGLNTDNKIIKILLDHEQRKYENLTDETKREYINGTGVIEDLLNQVKNSTVKVNEEIEWAKNEMKEVDVYKEDVGKTYRDYMKILEEFVDYHQQAIAIFSITMSITLLSGSAIGALRSYYSRKCTSQHKLLRYVKEKLNEISHKINKLEIEDRVNRRVEEMLSSREQRSARVNYNDEGLDTAIQEINANIESVEVENVSASKSTEHRLNQRA